jgi:hypothetical protein
MKQGVGFGVTSGVQPVLLGIDSNHRLVERDVIRALTVGRL